MAFQKDFQDNCGVSHANAYWKVVLASIDKSAKLARVVLYAYVDKASADTGKAPLLGAVKEYNVNGTQFDVYFATNVLNPAESDPYKSAYALASATLDVPVTPAVPAVPAVTDSEGTVTTPAVPAIPAVYASYFAGATAV